MPAMRRDVLLRRLRNLADVGDAEIAHSEADRLLLIFIDDAEITYAYSAVPKWYA